MATNEWRRPRCEFPGCGFTATYPASARAASDERARCVFHAPAEVSNAKRRKRRTRATLPAEAYEVCGCGGIDHPDCAGEQALRSFPRAADQLNRTDLISRLRDLDACDEALAWIERTPGEPEDLWAACPRGDWMIWLLVAAGYDERTLRHIACDCAEEVLHIYEQAHPTDRRPRDCIAVARRYADGEATDDELIAAREVVWDAVDYSPYAAARGAARAAVNAAAGDAVWSAMWTDEDWPAAMSRLADIVRTRVSWTDVEQAMERAASARG